MGLTRPRFSQFDTTISSISDPITVLNKTSNQANIDIGFLMNRNGGTSSNIALIWKESANSFVLAFSANTGEITASESNSNIAISEYANLRINVLTADTASFNSNGAVKIPTGNTDQRTIGATGEIRFNTTTSQFEGYQGASWSSLGGVRSVDNATYIIAESYPGAGNNALYFYTNNTLRANLSSTGLNLSGNILATTGTFSGMTVNGNESVTGYLNVTGNVMAAVVTASQLNTTGNILAQNGILNSLTVNGNETVTGYLNVTGNILGAASTFNGLTVNGYINNNGNISTAELNAGQINTTGNVLSTNGIFNELTVNGNESVTGYLNVTGNLIATLVKIGSVESTGVVYANSTTTATSTSTGALRVAGGAGIAGNVWADQVYATNNSNGKNFRIGDDAWLGDISVADTAQLMGVQNGNKGYLRFGNVSTQTLGRDGSGPLSWTGNLNITGNILAANVNASYFVGSGDALTNINAFGNIFVSGQSPVLADSTSDTLTLIGGSGITITTDAANDSITFTTVSTLGAFGEDSDFGSVTDTVTTSEDLGDLNSISATTYDLGTLVAASGLIYPDLLVLPSYTVAGLPSAVTPAQVVYVSNESGGAVLAFSDGTNWRRVTDRAIVS